MGSIVEHGWVLSLSLAAKCGGAATAADSPRLLFLAALFVLAVSATALLHWASPGGPAWGRYRWSLKDWRGTGTRTPEAKPIPGPRGLPIVGSIGLMSGLSHRKLAAAADAFAARRLMAISVGETRVVVTADPDVARDILSGPGFADRPVKESAYGLMFRRAIGFAPYGPYWRSLRRIAAAHLFSPSQIAAFADCRSAIAAQMVAALKSAAASAGGSHVEVRSVLKAASLSHMMWLVFGKKYNFNMNDETTWCEEMRELRFMVDEGYHLLGTLNWSDHLPALAGLDPQRVRSRCARLVPRVNQLVGRIIDERRFGPARDPDTAPAFVDVLLSLQDREQLSDEDMRAVLWEMIFRGTDTVAVLLEWVLARMALHRDVQARAHAELDRAGTDHHHHQHFPLPYLQAIIKETLRLHPPGPLLSWARLATSDTVLSGRHVPEGTTAVVNMWAIARDPTLWSRPDEFRPDRFIEPDGEAVGLSVFGSDLRLAPFGSGRRSCPGKALAMAAVGSWATALLHEFEWAPAPPAPVDLSEVMRLSLEMAVPLTVELRPRPTPKCI